jgi:hypothetical protein
MRVGTRVVVIATQEVGRIVDITANGLLTVSLDDSPWCDDYHAMELENYDAGR